MGSGRASRSDPGPPEAKAAGPRKPTRQRLLDNPPIWAWHRGEAASPVGLASLTSTGGRRMKGRHVRPRPNLLVRLRLVIARALAKVDQRQTPPRE